MNFAISPHGVLFYNIYYIGKKSIANEVRDLRLFIVSVIVQLNFKIAYDIEKC